MDLDIPEDFTNNIPFVRTLREKRPTTFEDSNVDDVIEGKRNFSIEEKLHDEKFDVKDNNLLMEMEGKDFNLKLIQEHGFNTPILFKEKEGLGLRVPDAELFSVNDVKSYVGARRMIDVFDCDTHSPEKMTVHQFVRYYMSQEKEKLLNVTSLEFSQTGLERLVDCPITIREDLDWVTLVWPKHLIAGQKDSTNAIENMKYPKVRKYCLMSVGGCYTDFHIDFGGTSVWYHVLKGSKVFWLIPPTDTNLDIYEKWMLSGRQQDVFFGDIVKDCFRIKLVAGDTFMIPTGWIHGVYTPEDSLVFGGNYLHCFNIPMQLRVYDIEEATHVPRHLRFPFFAEIHWYIVKHYVDILDRDMDERRKLEFEGDCNEEKEEDGGVFQLLKDELDDSKTEQNLKEDKQKWKCVYLTVFEIEGLKILCDKLRSWSYAKLNYPKELEEDGMELLDRLEELLQFHEDDDQILACNGINIFNQYADDRSLLGSPTPTLTPPKFDQSSPKKEETIIKTDYVKDEVDNSSLPEMKAVDSISSLVRVGRRRIRKIKAEEQQKEESKGKRIKIKSKKYIASMKEKTVIRRVRCNQCRGCSRENCNECRFCLDMKKNGGEGKLRQSCALRFCEDPQLPSYVVCKVCDDRGEGKGFLMECSACSEVVHPSCIESNLKKMKHKPLCKISKKVNNCWECPKCVRNSEDNEDVIEFSISSIEVIVNSFKKENKNPMARYGGIKHKISRSKVVLNKIKVKQNNKTTKKANREPESSDDDEPLIKKKARKIQGNGVATKPLPIITKVEPVVVVRPAPINNKYQYCLLNDNESEKDTHCLPREIWIRVFTYLQENEVNKCMLVCKAWNQWCLDNRLWKEIEVSNKPLIPIILKGIVRRQPQRLVLSSTNATAKQIEWLLNRLPRLTGLDLTLNTASAVSALLHVQCPPLAWLNLSWCDAIFDRFMAQIIGPIRNGKIEENGLSRLHFIENLNLTGCDVAFETMTNIFSLLPSLRHLDVSYCTKVKDKDFEVVKAGMNVNKGTLKRIICQGCQLVSQQLVDCFMTNPTLPALVNIH